MRHKFRWMTVAALALSALIASQAFAAITWGNAPGAASGRVGPNYSWNNGDPALVEQGSGVLGAVYVTDTIKGVFAQDDGPHMGVYYTRSTNDGGTWSKGFRLNPKTVHGDRVTLAASGNTVVAAYMDQKQYYQGNQSTFDTTQARFVWIRRNTGNGVNASWSPKVKLPGQNNASRGDYIYSAASGTNFYVATSTTNTGKIWLWRSTDSGATWSGPTEVGTTTATDNVTGYVGGFSGLPAVAATGDDVGVIWTSTAGGEVTARVSDDAGATWDAATVLEASGGNANNGYAQAAGRDNRLAFSWTTAAGAFFRIYNTTTDAWLTERTITTFPDPDAAVPSDLDDGGEGAIIALDAGGEVGISLSECNTVQGNICNNPQLSLANAKETLVWRQSSDNGATWSAASIVAPVTNNKGTFINNYGSAIFHDGLPYVYWNAHNSAYGFYTNQLRVGTGTP
ncbi:MAG: sialidase family protein [Actinomycetota bacterium]